MKAEIKKDLPMVEYLMHPALGSSTLKNMLLSPADFKAARWASSPPTPQTMLGEAIHTAILEPEKFDKLYMLQPEDWGPKNKGEGYKKWKAFKAEADDKFMTPIGWEEAQKITKVREAAAAHPHFNKILEKADVEITAFAELNGVDCKARADILTHDGWFWDVKTTAKPVDDETLSRTVFNWGYHFQAAHHSAVFQGCGREFQGWGWVFISTGTPAVHVVMRKATPEVLNCGFADWEYAIEQFKLCSTDDFWPGMSQDVGEIGLPHWAMRDYDEEK